MLIMKRGWSSRSRPGGTSWQCVPSGGFCEPQRAGDDGVTRSVAGSDRSGKGKPECAADHENPATLYHDGLRVLQLTFNRRNSFGDGCSESADAGLSRAGRSLVERTNELGVILDVSHCGARTSLETVLHSRRPVAVTHSACTALYDHPRAKTDDLLRALRDQDGYFGVVAVPKFLRADTDSASLDDVVRNIEHAANLVGIERGGIASDWGAYTPDVPSELYPATLDAFIKMGARPEEVPEMGEFPEGFRSWSDWPNITATLFKSGFDESTVRGFIGGNWLGFMRRTGN